MIFKIKNKFGETILSNISKDCDDCVNICDNSISDINKSFTNVVTDCKHNGKTKRIGIKNTINGKVFLCADSLNLINSSRVFKEKLSVYNEIIDDTEKFKSDLLEIVNKDIRRLLHNLTSINAHNIQEVYALVPQNILTEKIRDQISTIKMFINKNPDEAAFTFLRIAKNNISIKTEFSVFKKLYEASPSLNLKIHPIRKVLLNVLHIFFQDFTDNGVHVSVDDFNGSLLVDYESVHVALYHIVDNASKYVQPNTYLYINFVEDNNSITIRFKMMSLEIKDEEILKIYDEGYSGAYAVKSGKSGDGIGMTIITKLLTLNNAKLQIHKDINHQKRIVENGLNYHLNSFDVHFVKQTLTQENSKINRTKS